MQTLSLLGCKFTGSFPSSILSNTNLRNLDFGDNQLSGQFPASGWSNMNQLLTLSFDKIAFTGSVPTDFCNIPNLSSLMLSGQITLPNCLGQLTKLTYLSLTNMPITQFPAGLPLLTAVRYIVIQATSISGEIPDDFWNMQSLQTVYLDTNQISGIGSPSGKPSASKLTTLSLANNRITSLATLTGLTKVAQLSLDNNLIAEIPSSLTTNSGVTWIGLSHNSITTLPSLNWSLFTKLTLLDLSSNLIGSIPATIAGVNVNIYNNCVEYNHIKLDNNKYNMHYINDILKFNIDNNDTEYFNHSDYVYHGYHVNLFQFDHNLDFQNFNHNNNYIY
ncbi:L domain-like protein [Rhizoclosmatium globosum]|uniref:L domain-like protein n=1 Tax=Rhizoclosmatium globosum TaxID=329046 RepID=A0A1Y2CPW8_9FUNG|nr:L domain-like protein [Rhizoclosmatium globosum]|eukprot:ORY48884.1 L domain-like protein [Rhizoclosmatium globosum]